MSVLEDPFKHRLFSAARRNISSISNMLSLTHLEAFPWRGEILADECYDAFQKAGGSERYLRPSLSVSFLLRRAVMAAIQWVAFNKVSGIKTG